MVRDAGSHENGSVGSAFSTRLLIAALFTLGALVAAPQASGNFGPATNFAVGSEPTSVAIANLNGDSIPDMAVANWNSLFVSVLIGQGDGSFGPATNFNAVALPSDPGAFPRSVAAGDLNGDGFQDLVVGRGGLGLADEVAVLFGNGDGTFDPLTLVPVGGTDPWSVVVGNFNGDSFQDIASANRNTDNVSVIPGNGDGTFGPATTYPVGAFPTSIASSNLNGDAFPDLVTTNANSDNVSVLLADGAGSFNAAVNLPVGNYPFSVAIGNLNGDSSPDLAVADNLDDTVTTLINNGSGTFGSANSFAAGEAPTSVAIGDLTGSSASDLAVTNTGASDSLAVFSGDGNGTFSPALNLIAGDDPSFVAIGQLNGDGLPDLAVTNEFSDNVSVLLGSGSDSPLAATASPSTLAFGKQFLGTNSAVRTVTIANNQASPLAIDFAGIAGEMQDEFNFISSTCDSNTLPVDGECEVSVSFEPSAKGAKEAWIEVFPVGPGRPLSVPLSGTGVSKANISKVTVTGPNKVKRGTAATWKVRASNTGGTAATGVKLRVSGRGITFNASIGRIQGGATRTVRVRVKPKKPGKVKASFKVTSGNAGGKTVKKTVTVTG